MSRRVRLVCIPMNPGDDGWLAGHSGPPSLTIARSLARSIARPIHDVRRQMGAYHTLDLELQRNFTISKQVWDTVVLDRLEEACDPVKQAEVAAVVMQPGLANVCLLTSAMTIVRQRIDVRTDLCRAVLGCALCVCLRLCLCGAKTRGKRMRAQSFVVCVCVCAPFTQFSFILPSRERSLCAAISSMPISYATLHALPNRCRSQRSARGTWRTTRPCRSSTGPRTRRCSATSTSHRSVRPEWLFGEVGKEGRNSCLGGVRSCADRAMAPCRCAGLFKNNKIHTMAISTHIPAMTTDEPNSGQGRAACKSRLR